MTDDDQTRRLSPQEKKAHSYKLDRRNAYSENSKASRKLIPLRKAQENRRTRRDANQQLSVHQRLDVEKAAVVESDVAKAINRIGGWKKSPDQTLEAHIIRQDKRRIERTNRKSKDN